MKALALLLLLAPLASAEDYRCTDPQGCTAHITEDGEPRTETFRRGDIVSTEDGWTIPDAGWKKLHQKDTPPPTPPEPDGRPWWERFWDWISWIHLGAVAGLCAYTRSQAR